MAYLRAARAALARGQAAAALTAIDAYRRELPDGQMAQEASALRIEIQCRLGQVEQAARARAAFIARWPASPHRARVERSCDGALP